MIAAVEYYDGKVVGFGNLSMFSSLGREYGFGAFDNSMIIANILKWLTVGAYSEGKAITVNLILELYHWIQSVMRDGNWESMSDLINISLKYFKDNYKDIVQEIEKTQKERMKKKKEFEESKKKGNEEDRIEEKIIEMIPVRKKEDLEDIMSALGNITGEKYEIEIDLDAMEEEEIEEALKKIEDIEEQQEKKREDISTETKEKEKISSETKYTEQDIQVFEKAHNKHAIWRGKPTNAFKLWLKVKKTK